MSVSATEPVFEELRAPLTREDALLEADRCLECGGPYAPAPCMVACPAGVDVASFVAAIADGDPESAAETIFAENLLGATCARVCPAEVLCEGACVLAEVGRQADRDRRAPALRHGTRRLATARRFAKRATWNGRRVAVIGAGPAGLVCAGELAALGYGVTVFDEREEVGGLVRYAIAPYRQLQEPLPDEAAELVRIGVEFRLGSHVGAASSRRSSRRPMRSSSGVGMGPDAEVSYPGDDLPGVWESLPFIERIKTGPPCRSASTQWWCRGRQYRDRRRASRLCGSARHPRPSSIAAAKPRCPRTHTRWPRPARRGFAFQFLADPVHVLGSDRAEAVVCRRMRLGAPDASGRRRPEPVAGVELTLPAETVVKAIGQQPRRELADWIAALELEPAGTVRVDPATGRTSNPKFFAGGDVINGGVSVVEAVRDAKRAARAIDGWLRWTA